MTNSKKILEKKNVINYRNNKQVDSSFLLVIENKKGKIIGLSATLNKDNDIELYGLSKGNYKVLKTIKKEALVDNDRVKSVYGNTKVALEMRNLIHSNQINEIQSKQMAESIKVGSVLDNVSNEIDDFVLSKIEQNIEEKRIKIEKINKEKIENKALLLFKEDSGKNRFVSVIKSEDKYFIEKTNKHISGQEIINNPNIKGVFGNSELASEVKKLFSNPKFEFVDREENDKTVEDIHSFFKEKEKNKNKTKLKRK